MKITGIQVFSIGKDKCSHKWIYDKPTAITFAVPSNVIQERVCEYCGRLERVHMEGKQAKSDIETFSLIKQQFGL
jgi:hypothetical protein